MRPLMSRRSRFGLALGSAAMLVSLGAGAVFGGEVTGNGALTPINDGPANSICSFSGQEDLQYFFDDLNTMPKPEPTRGNPGHAQSWGQIPKADRDFLTTVGAHPGDSCNGHTGEFAE